jgi:hypothetical protein
MAQGARIRSFGNLAELLHQNERAVTHGDYRLEVRNYEPATPTYQPFQGEWPDAWVKTLGYFKSLPLGLCSNNRD